jgi:hypothetical protein
VAWHHIHADNVAEYELRRDAGMGRHDSFSKGKQGGIFVSGFGKVHSTVGYAAPRVQVCRTTAG